MACSWLRKVCIYFLITCLCSVPGLYFLCLSFLPETVRLIWLIVSSTVMLVAVICSCFVDNTSIIVLLTLLQCTLPLLGYGVKLVFHTTLFFGPATVIAINASRIVGSLLCLVGLFLREKLMIIRVFLLPVMSTLQEIGFSRDNVNQLVQELGNHTMATLKSIAAGLQEPIDWTTADSLDISRQFARHLSDSCIATIRKWETECPKIIGPACRSKFPIISDVVCPGIVKGTCTITDATAYCLPNDESRYLGHHVDGIKKALTNLTDSMSFGAAFSIPERILGRPISSDLVYVRDIFGYTVIGFWITVGSCWTVFIFNRIWLAVKVTGKYHTDLRYHNNRLDVQWAARNRPELLPLKKCEIWQHSLVGFIVETFKSLLFKPQKLAKHYSLVLAILTLTTIDGVLSLIGQTVNRFHFKVPIHGGARLVFAVQGTSTLAQLLQAILSGFNVVSEDCQIADSESCSFTHQSMSQETVILLWLLAAFYCLHQRIEDNIEYVLCRFCDFLSPARAAERWDFLATRIIQRRSTRTEKMADIFRQFNGMDSEIRASCTPGDYRRRLTRLYVQWRPYFNALPILLINLIAVTRYKLKDVRCRICWTAIADVCCQCTFICRDCSSYVHQSHGNDTKCSQCQEQVSFLLND